MKTTRSNGAGTYKMTIVFGGNAIGLPGTTYKIVEVKAASRSAAMATVTKGRIVSVTKIARKAV